MKILIKPWKEAELEAFPIREEVFIKEQGVPADLEIDEFDLSASHAIAYQGDRCVGTGRLVHLGNGQAQIGRMAVLTQFRGKGVGKLILSKLIDLATTEGISSLVLHSQIIAIPFYEKLGFQADGPSYDEVGIEHRNMIVLLPK